MCVCACGMMYMAFDLSPVDNFSLLSSSDLFGGEREIEGTFSSFPCTLYLHTWYFLRKQFRSIPRLIDSVKSAVSPTERIYGPDLVLNCSGVPRDLLQIALQLFCAIVRVRSSLKRRWEYILSPCFHSAMSQSPWEKLRWRTHQFNLFLFFFSMDVLWYFRCVMNITMRIKSGEQADSLLVPFSHTCSGLKIGFSKKPISLRVRKLSSFPKEIEVRGRFV